LLVAVYAWDFPPPMAAFGIAKEELEKDNPIERERQEVATMKIPSESIDFALVP